MNTLQHNSAQATLDPMLEEPPLMSSGERFEGHGEDHRPALLEQVCRLLEPGRGGVLVDATVGYGGHAEALLQAGGSGIRLIGFDCDGQAISAALKRLDPFRQQVTLIRGNFSALTQLLAEAGVPSVQGILFDLGLSSPLVEDGKRGFSFRRPGPLDMRMDQRQERKAEDLVRDLSAEELTDILRTYGEERYARQIARGIVLARQKHPITRTDELAALVASTIPRKGWPRGRHPATRTFQALRIAVNQELDSLALALNAAVEAMAPEGRLGVISYHSLEDRIVKRTFRHFAMGCQCPPSVAVCVCGGQSILEILTKRPITPDEEEVHLNPRARSAKFRAARRIP